MGRATKKRLLLGMISALLMIQVSVTALQNDAGVISPMYNHAQSVFLDLSFTASSAECFAYVTPKSTHDVDLRISLYQKVGDDWKYLTSWSNSGVGPSTVYVNGSFGVGSGTYKAVLSVNIGNIESISKSITGTK